MEETCSHAFFKMLNTQTQWTIIKTTICVRAAGLQPDLIWAAQDMTLVAEIPLHPGPQVTWLPFPQLRAPF